MNKQLERTRRGKRTIYFHSIRNARVCWCESALERDHMIRLEFDDDVLAYRPQPLSVLWDDLGRSTRYTPDVLIWRRGGMREFVEVKPREEVDPELRWKLTVLNQRLRDRFNAPLNLITDDQIRDGHNIENLRRLYGYKRFDLTRVGGTQLLEASPRVLSFGDLRAQAERAELPAELPFALLAHGRWRFDLAVPLSDDTMLEAA